MKPPRSACSEAARGLWTPGAQFASVLIQGEVKLVDACGMRRERFEDVTKETGERMEARVGHGLTGSRMLDGYVQVLESAQESVWHSDERSGSMTAGSAQHLEGGGQPGGQWANVVSSCGASDRHGLRPARVHSPT